ncbi:MAG: hypothetical protein ABEI54_03940, partial [Candidatus Bipolaricaulia bacterium]
MYAKVSADKIIETGNRPNWYYPKDHDTYPGDLITDDSIYRKGGLTEGSAGWFLVSDEEKPNYNPETENPPEPKPKNQWRIESDRVVRTWSAPEAKSLSNRKDYLLARADDKYLDSLSRGFAYDNGIFRADIPERRQRLQELVAQINAYRNGDAANKLP